MKTYTFKVTVLVAEEWLYQVEAETEEEARGMAECGETVAESKIGIQGVHDRFIEDMPGFEDDARCATCRVSEHDTCPLTPGCPCCVDTLEWKS